MNYSISDAAKEIEVESHVLRYWEEELDLKIERNKAGHRFYSREQIEELKRVKEWKQQGLQLKAIKKLLENNKEKSQSVEAEGHISLLVRQDSLMVENNNLKREKAVRAAKIIKDVLTETIRECNKELKEQIREEVVKEMDFQFRQQQEFVEEKTLRMEELQEEHYRKVDQILAEYRQKGKRKKHSQ